MKLRQFLNYNNITSREFSKSLGISEVSLSRYLNGKRFPDKKMLIKIYELSDGQVDANDFYLETKTQYELSNEDEILIEKLLDDVKKGSRKSLAKVITLIESTKLEDKKKSEKLISKLLEEKNTLRIGISGVPGVGKSTFIESMGLFLIKKGFKVAVLAVDPSSQRTGGSILGDKTRMQNLSNHQSAFIRPSPSSGHLGGVTKTTRESISCLEAANYDIIFVETMGVGQAETAVFNLVDMFLVLLLPSGGDDLQGIKKGIIEMADLLVVNKSDSNLLSAATSTVSDYKNALSIINAVRDDWTPKVLKCSSIKLTGLTEIWESILIFWKTRKKNKNFSKHRSSQKINWMWELINNKFDFYVEDILKKEKVVQKIEEDVLFQKLNPSVAASSILRFYIKKFN